jgi:AraC-like DNA-binding protein
MASSINGSLLEQRFGVRNPPTLISAMAQVGAVSFSRLRIAESPHPLGTIPADPAYSVSVNLAALRYTVLGKHRSAGRHHVAQASTCIHDVEDPPPITLESAADTLRFYVPRAALRAIEEDAGVDRGGILRTTPDGLDDRLAFNMARCLLPMFESPETVEPMLVDQVALAFMTHLLRTCSAEAPVRPLPTGGLAPWQVKLAKEALAASKKSVVSIADVAKICGLSAAHFSRAFKRATGRSPHRWLIEHRCHEAKALLEHSALSIEQIAQNSGFANQPHFTRTFARFVGATPGSWRRLRRL